jgi:hypothetical protein
VEADGRFIDVEFGLGVFIADRRASLAPSISNATRVNGFGAAEAEDVVAAVSLYGAWLSLGFPGRTAACNYSGRNE